MARETYKVIPIKDQSAVILEDGTIYKVQQKRQRRVLNCMPCHKRKVKCNRARPVCDHCIRNNYECAYFVNDRVSRGGHNRVPKECKQQLLKVIEKARKVVQEESKGVSEKDLQNGEVKNTMETTVSNLNILDDDNDGSQKTRGIEQPFFVHEGKGQLTSSTLLGSILEGSSISPSSDTTLVQVNMDTLQLLPSKTRCMELLEYYKIAVHPIIPLTSIDNFLQENMHFWESWTGTVDHKSIDFLLLLIPMMYAAAKAKFHQTYDATLIEETNSYHNTIRKLYSLSDFPNKFSLNSLIGCVLLNSIVENPNITSVSQLTRLAQRFQLTSDPVSYHGMTDQDMIQTRRILFWQIFQLDTLTSLHNNLPPLIKSGDFDTSLPTELSPQGFLDPHICFLNAKYRFAVLMNELCQENLNHGKSRDRGAPLGIKKRIIELHACCTGSAIALNNYFQRDGPSDPAMNTFIPWAIFMLNTFADRSLLLLHLFLIRKSLPVISKRKKIRPAKSENCDPILDSGYGDDSMGILAILNNNCESDHSVSKPLVYNYEDLQNNLIPASLHYLDEFIKYQSDDTYSIFNWELLVGHMPINAITFALKTLALDLNRTRKTNSYLQLQFDLRYILLSKAIPTVEAKIDIQTAACKHCFQLIKLLFHLVQVKYGNTEKPPGAKLFFNKYEIPQILDPNNNTPMVPQPSASLWSNQNIPPAQKHCMEPLSFQPAMLLPVQQVRETAPTPMFDDAFLFSGNFLYSSDEHFNSTSCAQIAPRTMKAIVEGFMSDDPDSWNDLLSSFNLDMPSNPAETDESQEIAHIYSDVQKYILLLNDNDHDVEYVSTAGSHYREFENALLEILCDLLKEAPS